MSEWDHDQPPSECLKLRGLLREQTRLLDILIQLVVDSKTIDPDVRRVIFLMIQGFGVSTHSILQLTAEIDMAIRDCFAIARTAAELAVNICYIEAVGGEAARRAQRHALQKSYRDTIREGTVGGTSFKAVAEGLPPASAMPGLEAALKEFTGRKGQEITDWTPLSMSARIDAVRSSHVDAALSLSGSTAVIYRHSSEILHGTFFGITYFWSAGGSPVTSRLEYTLKWQEHFVVIFMTVFFSADAMLKFFSTRLDDKRLYRASNELARSAEEIVRPFIAKLDDPAKMDATRTP